MKISLSSFAKNSAAFLFLSCLVASGVGVAYWGVFPFFTNGSINLQMVLISVCSLPVFGFLFMWIDEGISAREFAGKYVLLPIATVLFLALIVAVCIFVYTTVSEASTTNILLFCIAVFLAIIAFRRKK